MTYAAQTVLFHGGPENEQEARAYIKRYGLTHEDVKLLRREHEIIIVAKRDVNLCENPNS